MPRDLVLATRNPHKGAELTAILAGLPVRIRTMDEFPDIPDVVEDGETCEANAVKKARAVAEATGFVAVADDTGLEVDALGGRPGVYAARYAGLQATSEKVEVTTGRLDGLITEAQAGEQGFGYDPVFYVPDLGKTLAELSSEEKNRISHRAKAFAQVRELLQNRLRLGA